MSQITTHVLDTALGKPAAGIAIDLFSNNDGLTVKIAGGVTNEDGRIGDLLGKDEILNPGYYTMRFDLIAYFEGSTKTPFYPEAIITFYVADDSHYHIPLLLSPFGYSTYRGS